MTQDLQSLKHVYCDRPKYIPMKPKQVAKLSPEDRQEYTITH
jgi:hypothetical protein